MILGCDYRQFALRRGDESNHKSHLGRKKRNGQKDAAFDPLKRKVYFVLGSGDIYLLPNPYNRTTDIVKHLQSVKGYVETLGNFRKCIATLNHVGSFALITYSGDQCSCRRVVIEVISHP